MKLYKKFNIHESESLSDKLKNVGSSIGKGLEKFGESVNKGLDELEKVVDDIGKGMSDDLTRLGKEVNKCLDDIEKSVSNVGKYVENTITQTIDVNKLYSKSIQTPHIQTANIQIQKQNEMSFSEASILNGYVDKCAVQSVSLNLSIGFVKAYEIFKVLKQHDFPKSDLVYLTTDDYAAISYCISVNTAKKRWELYQDLPVSIRRRMTFWLLQGCSFIEGADYYGPEKLGAILKHYTLVSSRPLPEKISWGIRLAKTVISSLTGVPLPQVRTLYLGSIWCRMGIEMLRCSKYDSLELGGAIISMFCGLIPSLVKEEIQGMTLLFCNDGDGNWNKLSFEMRKFLGKLTKNQNVDETSCAAWNKTLGVLIRNEKLSINGSSRMLSTYSMGTSFIRSICCKGDIKTFLNGISPLPSSFAINNLIKLFRSYTDYVKRKKSIIYNEMDSIVQSSERIQHVVPVYREVLKLNYAYLPGELHSPYGTYCTASCVGRDELLILEIANKFSVPNKENLIVCITNMIADMEKTDPKYIEFFGVSEQKDRSGRLYSSKLTNKQKDRVKSVVTTLLLAGAAITVGEILEGYLDTEDIFAEGVDTDQADIYSGYINEEELMKDFNPEDIEGLPDTHAYNISFKSDVTLQTPGNGQTLPANVKKKPGTANVFILTTKNGTVEVKGTDSKVRIGNIVYMIPKLS